MGFHDRAASAGYLGHGLQVAAGAQSNSKRVRNYESEREGHCECVRHRVFEAYNLMQLQ